MRPGETISSSSLFKRSGGKGANQAVAVAKAGGAVSLVGAIGPDGASVKDNIAQFGVDVQGIELVQVHDLSEYQTGFITLSITIDE